MKKLIIPVAAAFILFTMQYCSKGGGGGCSEGPMTIVTTPANGSTEVPAVGPDFPLQVNITGGLPAAGVTIEVKAREESKTTYFYTETKSASAAITNFTITGTPSTVASKVEITVTSKSCNTNKVSLSYSYSKK